MGYRCCLGGVDLLLVGMEDVREIVEVVRSLIGRSIKQAIPHF